MKLLVKALIVVLGLLFGLLLLEGVVRLAGLARPPESMGWFWRVPDEITGWSLEPGAEGRSYNDLYEYDVAVKINSRGIRSPESIGYDKPEGVYRILVLGDSFVEAIQVEMEEMFGRRLDELLNEKGYRVEVISAGVGGWGNDQELLWLQNEGYKYHPDLILLTIFARNDFMNNYQPLEAANMGANNKPYFQLEPDGELSLHLFPFDPAEAPPPPPRPDVIIEPEPIPPGPLTPVGNWLWRHSALYRWIVPRLRLLTPRLADRLARIGIIEPGVEQKKLAQPPDYVPISYETYRKTADETWLAAFELTRAILRAFQSEAAGMDADFAVVLANAQEEVYPLFWQKVTSAYPVMRGDDWSPEMAHQRILTILREEQISALDLRPAFREAYAENHRFLHYPVDGHWTPDGHALAARRIADFLEANGFLPSEGQ
jgi:hypothetical protein